MNLYSDSIPKEDLLGRKEFAAKIAKGLVIATKMDTEGFVTALTGKWGSGKSSLLSFLKEELIASFANENVSYTIIDFNPWMFTDAENIKHTFLKELSQVLGHRKQQWWKKFGSKASKRMEYLDVVHPIAGKLGKELGTLLHDYLETNTSLGFKKKIDEALLKANKKIFVFIDDIDRLYPKQIFEILQVLKLSGNFKNTYYVLAFDREAVEISIESQFKDYGKKYLDKIVQADFLIPEPPDEKIESIFFSALNNLFREHKISYSPSSFSSIWLHHNMRAYFSTLRDVYRYINSLQFSLPIIPDDLNINDFLVLEAIRLHDFDAYKTIHVDFNRANYLLGNNTRFASDEFLKKFEHTTTRKLIQYLFPENRLALAQSGNKKRLYDPQYFERYFTLSVSDKDVAELEFRRFLEIDKGRFDLLTNIASLGRIDNLVIRLTDSELNKQYNDWDFSLIEELMRFFNIYSRELPTDPHRLADAIVNLLMQKQQMRETYFNKFLDHLLSVTKEIDNSKIYFLHFMLWSKEENNGFPNQALEFKEFYLGRYDKIKDFYLTHCLKGWEAYFIGNKIIPQPLSLYTHLFIYDYAVWSSGTYQIYLNSLLKVEENLLYFLKNILSISVTNEALRIDGKQLKVLLPLTNNKSDFVRALKNIDVTRLSKEQKQWREFALHNLN